MYFLLCKQWPLRRPVTKSLKLFDQGFGEAKGNYWRLHAWVALTVNQNIILNAVLCHILAYWTTYASKLPTKQPASLSSTPRFNTPYPHPVSLQHPYGVRFDLSLRCTFFPAPIQYPSDQHKEEYRTENRSNNPIRDRGRSHGGNNWWGLSGWENHASWSS